MMKLQNNFNLEGLTLESTYLNGFNWLDSELTSNNDYMLELVEMFANDESEPATERQIEAFLDMCSKKGIQYNGNLNGVTKGKMAELFERVAKVSSSKQRKIVCYIAEQFLTDYPSKDELMDFDFCSDMIDSFQYMMRETRERPTKKQLFYIKKAHPELTPQDLALLTKEEATSLINLTIEQQRVETDESNRAKKAQLKDTYRNRLRDEWIDSDIARRTDREYDNPTTEQYFARLLKTDGYTADEIAQILHHLTEAQEMTL